MHRRNYALHFTENNNMLNIYIIKYINNNKINRIWNIKQNFLIVKTVKQCILFVSN